MNCISLWQPWASLCCIPHPDDPIKSVKGFETRHWFPKYNKYYGELLIHAAKKFNRDQIEISANGLFREQLLRHYRSLKDMPLGAIVGKVNFLTSYTTEDGRDFIDKYAQEFGDYSNDRYAWEFIDPVLFSNPIPHKGQQGFFNVGL